MVRAWLMDNSSADKQLPHLTNPPRFLDVETLKTLTGCLYFQLDPDNYQSGLDEIASERGYNYQDEITTSADDDEQLKTFYIEHFHPEEEVRYCSDGSGYFDVRDKEDRWIRMEVTRGDLLILPGGIYHRFTLDKANYSKFVRCFIGQPVRTAFNRPAEDHPARKAYLQALLSKG